MMAERRMFAKSIINSARFLRMPVSSRLLYYDLGMQADDDGVVEAFAVMRATGATEDDLRVLSSKGFIKILNDDLVSVITDWSRNNLIKKDRYKKSIYSDLLVQFGTQTEPTWNPNGTSLEPQDRLGKDRLGNNDNSLRSLSCPEPSCENAEIEDLHLVIDEKKDIFTTLPLKDGGEAEVTYEIVQEFKALFPFVNVEQEIRNAKSWLKSHPERRKTDWYRFLANWLRKESREADERRQARQGCPRDYNPENQNIMKEAEDVQI